MDTISGIQNEVEFTAGLDNKQYKQLNSNAAKFIGQLYPEISEYTTIHAKKVGGQGLKPDVVVTVDNDDTNVSIKKGSGNSVHQEKISLFLLYCKDYLGMSDKTRDCFLAFLYGDGTLDGKGQIEDRLDGNNLRERYKEEIKEIQSFLNTHRRPLIERFLIYGRLGMERNIKADYLYHGFITDGVWCPLDETVDFLVEKASTEQWLISPSIGPLTIQTWNRNLDGVIEREDRRHSIQVKWGGKIREYIIQINEQYLAKIKTEPALARPRIFGDNSHGFNNAKEIAAGLDGCRVRNLRGSLLGLINNVFTGVSLTDVIHAKVINSAKPDIAISIGSKSANVSVFLGTGNSVHQENFKDFLVYCKETLGMTTQVENALRLIYYGDGTTDGKGKVSDRIKDSRTVKKLYPYETTIVQSFFDKHRRSLAKRFLVTGKYIDKPNADYIFHGDVHEGISMSMNSVLDYIEQCYTSGDGLLSIGPLSLQVWNRNLSGDKDKEYKRESLQIKFGSMPKRIEEAYALMRQKQLKSKIEGINTEYELASMLNRNRSSTNPLWQIIQRKINIVPENTIALRVSHQVHSDFLEQTIYPKSDIILCKANVNNETLANIGYDLDEDNAKEFNIRYTPIIGSGISCKIPTSEKFTYAKMSISSFAKIVGNMVAGAGASIFVQPSEIHLNPHVIKCWGISEQKFLEFTYNIPGCQCCDTINEFNEKDWAEIKKFSNRVIYDIIHNNPSVSDMVFCGTGLFKEPYNAKFIWSEGKLKLNTAPQEFTVTTGSGRHKDKFTIIIKPGRIGRTSSDNPIVVSMTREYQIEEVPLLKAAEEEYNPGKNNASQHQINSKPQDRILSYLFDHPDSMAKDIASALGLDRRDVNSALYGRLSSKVVQNSNYEWRLKEN